MKKPYIKALDALRIVAISAVVLVHTTTRTIEASKFNLNGYLSTLFLNQIGKFAVPLFFIVSGFSLELNYQYHANYFDYLKKRFSRILIPYIFWSGIYYLFVYTNNSQNFLRVLYLGSASYQLYFIPALLIFYLIFPLLHKMYDFLANKWVLLVLIFSQMFLLHQDYFVKPYKLDDPFHAALLSYFVFILGMVAARNKDKILEFAKKWKLTLAGITVLSGFYIFWEGFTGYIKTGNYLAYYSNFRPSILIYTLFLGSILYYLFDKSRIGSSLMKILARLTFFVFFIHVIILEKVWILFGNSLFNIFSESAKGKIFFAPVFFGIVLSISFLIAFVIRKIPFASKIMG